MHYALLVFQDEKRGEDVSEAARADLYAEHHRLLTALGAAGAMRGSGRFKPSYTATTVRNAGGETRLSEGPHEETVEQLGGFYLIEAAHLDQALEYARHLPSFTVEVRPVAELAIPADGVPEPGDSDPGSPGMGSRAAGNRGAGN